MTADAGQATDTKLNAPSPKSSTYSKAHAVIIAVANYRQLNPLPVAVLNDAHDLASVLTSPQHCGYDPKNVRLLLDGDATLSKIRAALTDVALASNPDESVAIFFSGHGALLGTPSNPTSALLPVDCTIADVGATSLSESEFSSALHAIKAQRLVVFLDACHSAGAASFKTESIHAVPRLGYSEKALSSLAQGTGRVLIASSRASETSLVLPRSRNSVFTQHLLEILRGQGQVRGDGVIRVFDVFNYVSANVRRTSTARQHPVFKASDLEENFPIALDRGGSKQVITGQSMSSDPQSDYWSSLEAVLSELYPSGPLEEEIWTRAGGDPSRLPLSGTGRARWFSALRTLRQGGGGPHIDRESLIRAALAEYPHHAQLGALLAS